MITEIIIDGKNATFGRLASYVAKQALLGKKIVVVNSNEVVIIGTKQDILKKYKARFKIGGASQKGPKIIRNPERILKRAIRGMLSHKQGRGSDAFERVRCYNEVPAEYEKLEKIAIGTEKHGKYITLKELAKELK